MIEKGRIDKVTVLKPKEQLLYDKKNEDTKKGFVFKKINGRLINRLVNAANTI
jgi:hypothetical protein